MWVTHTHNVEEMKADAMECTHYCPFIPSRQPCKGCWKSEWLAIGLVRLGGSSSDCTGGCLGADTGGCKL